MQIPRNAYIIILSVILTGCNKNAVPDEAAPSAALPSARTTAPPTTTTTPPPRIYDPGTARFLGLTAPKPVTWIEHPPTGSMREANYTVPGRDGNEAAQIVVFYFGPTQGGTIENNISRWRSQFQLDENGDVPEPKIERFEVDSMPVTLLELTGEWMEMGTVSFTPDQVFLSAIVEAPVGKVFIRFTGPTATVQANREDFMSLLRGLRRESTP